MARRSALAQSLRAQPARPWPFETARAAVSETGECRPALRRQMYRAEPAAKHRMKVLCRRRERELALLQALRARWPMEVVHSRDQSTPLQRLLQARLTEAALPSRQSEQQQVPRTAPQDVRTHLSWQRVLQLTRRLIPFYRNGAQTPSSPFAALLIWLLAKAASTDSESLSQP